MTLRIIREPKGATIVIGPWWSRIAWDRNGRFTNGSHYFSGWYRWADEVDA